MKSNWPSREDVSRRLFTYAKLYVVTSEVKEMSRKRKTANRNHMEDKVGRKILRMMPELPKLFEKLFARVERFDGTEPKTFIAGMEEDCEDIARRLKGRLQGKRGRRVGRFLWFLFGKLAARAQSQARQRMREVVETTKRSAAEDPRYSLILKLMREADEKVPFASLIVSFLYADPKAMLVPQSVPLRLFKQANEASGEARATLALDALAKTAELLYKPYVHTVWILSYVREGKRPPQAPEFGDLLRVTHERLADLPGLVEKDAGWMRNSAVHNPPDYVLEEDSLWLWGRNHPRTKVRVDDLLEMAQRMYVISAATIQRVAQLYMLRDFFLNTGLFDMFVGCAPYIFASDEQRLAAAEQEMSEYAKSLIEPFETFFDLEDEPDSRQDA
jgi:hypothetical protein